MSGPLTSSDPAVPPVVPGYRLEALLGRGGSGEVWRAVPRAGGPPVAIKVLVAGDPERQTREAALLGGLDHPHLVRLHEVVHQPRRGAEPRVALVLDLLAGGSLAALLDRRGRMRPGEVVTTIAPVAAALAHTHEHGVVHGDLSPGNILFTAEGRPVLTDLGVARVLGEAASGEVTPAYVDPVVARGGAPGPASDVFGLAAAAFHALTGIAPWNAAGPADTLTVAAGGQLPDLAELAPSAPPELLRVIARGLSAEPADRGSAAAFALDLRHACRPEPVRLAASPVEGRAPTGRAARTALTPAVRRRPAPAPPEPETQPRWTARLLAAVRTTAALPRARRLAVAVPLVAVLAAAAWVGTARLGSAPTRDTAAVSTPAPGTTEPAPASGASRVPSSSNGWRDLVNELYGRRAQAFTSGSPTLLAGVWTAGSRQLGDDAAYLGSLGAAHQVLRGFSPRVAEVREAAVSGGRAELRLVDAWEGYDVVAADDPGGPAVAHEAGRSATEVTVVLLRTAAGWRIDSVERTQG